MQKGQGEGTLQNFVFRIPKFVAIWRAAPLMRSHCRCDPCDFRVPAGGMASSDPRCWGPRVVYGPTEKPRTSKAEVRAVAALEWQVTIQPAFPWGSATVRCLVFVAIQPSPPWGSGWPATGVFISRGGPGEGVEGSRISRSVSTLPQRARNPGANAGSMPALRGNFRARGFAVHPGRRRFNSACCSALAVASRLGRDI